jgi:hypothetical protein
VVAFYHEHGIGLSSILTDRVTELCGTQCHDYELYLTIDHSHAKTTSSQTNGYQLANSVCQTKSQY